MASLADQELELRIQAEGLLLRAEMLAWERTGKASCRSAAEQHQQHMFALIKSRPHAAMPAIGVAEVQGTPT